MVGPNEASLGLAEAQSDFGPELRRKGRGGLGPVKKFFLTHFTYFIYSM